MKKILALAALIIALATCAEATETPTLPPFAFQIKDLSVGTNVGTVTNAQGQFSLTTPAGKDVLRITYVGMDPLEVTARPNMRILLTSDRTALDEVVVVAYGTAKKQSITGSVASIDSKEIEQRIGTSVTGALEGAAPGVQVNNTYGEPGAEPNIRIRGIG